MFGAGIGARFTGIMAWRGLVPMERLPPHQRRLVGANWVGVGGHVVTYPLRRGEMLNFVGVVERDDWRVESWNEPGSREECLRDLANWHEDVQDHHPQHRYALQMGAAGAGTAGSLRPGPRLRDGRRGASDAAVPGAGRQHGAGGRDGDRPLPGPFRRRPDALRRYEHARLERTAAIVRGSSDNTKRFHNPALGSPEGAAAYVEREFQPEKVKQRYDWLYEYDALTVAL